MIVFDFVLIEIGFAERRFRVIGQLLFICEEHLRPVAARCPKPTPAAGTWSL